MPPQMRVMATTHGAWVQQLSVPGGPSVPVARPVGTVDEYRETLGDGPVQWSIRAAQDLTSRVIDEIPSFTPGTPTTTALHTGIEAAVLGVLASISVGRVEDGSLTFAEGPQAEHTAGDLVHHHVSLTDVWASIMHGHALLAGMLMSECQRLVGTDAVADELAGLNTIAFEFFNRLTERIARSYAAEHERRVATAIAIREEALALLLSPADVDLAGVSRSLR